MLKIFGNWWKGIKGVQLCACSHFSGYATNLFTCRLTYLAPFARAQFLVSLSCRRSRRILFSSRFFLSCRRSRRILFSSRFFFLLSSFFFLLSSFFFFLATRLFHILPYIRFWPNLVKVTSTLTTTQAQTMVGSEVTMGSLGSKRSFSPKRHQVLQNT